jgi:hypothetical protein
VSSSFPLLTFGEFPTPQILLDLSSISLIVHLHIFFAGAVDFHCRRNIVVRGRALS